MASSSRPSRPTTFNLLLYDDEDLKEMFGDIYTLNNDLLSLLLMSLPVLSCVKDPYSPLTLDTNNIARRSILLTFPPPIIVHEQCFSG
ncbi:unnamed protein product [Didymodactylos carnosus]|uniref:Uncharacterized protein n=1 Tax=Didymodactylos carnosus TaxID=1234261 RepID=A0A815HHI6_9BILA|nr:unnamed protein product [Didymodactylos carnosus]CAF4227803.1 unnamed protein product [Didymodactylos carnosus]